MASSARFSDAARAIVLARSSASTAWMTRSLSGSGAECEIRSATTMSTVHGRRAFRAGSQRRPIQDLTVDVGLSSRVLPRSRTAHRPRTLLSRSTVLVRDMVRRRGGSA
jgi:hypothetical protein